MSLPATGHFAATLFDTPVEFDGRRWTVSDGDAFLRLALEKETPRHQGQHLTCADVGRRVLEALAPGRWQETAARSDGWPTMLPDGAVD